MPHFHRPGESDPYITSPNIFYQSFHQRPSRNDHLVGHCHILFAKEISGRFLTFLILDSITSYKFLENMNATICIIYNQESHQKFD